MTNELRSLLQKIADNREDSVFITDAEAAIARSALQPGRVTEKCVTLECENEALRCQECFESFLRDCCADEKKELRREIERLHAGLRTLRENCPEERCENGKIRAFGEIVDCENCADIDALLSASVHEPKPPQLSNEPGICITLGCGRAGEVELSDERGWLCGTCVRAIALECAQQSAVVRNK